MPVCAWLASWRRGIFKGRDREGRKAWRHNAAAQEGLRASIRAVLQELYERHNEVNAGLSRSSRS